MPKKEITEAVHVVRPLTINELELQRKIKNRISAIEARKRGKARIDELEARVQALMKENEKLKSENAKLLCNGKSRPTILW